MLVESLEHQSICFIFQNNNQQLGSKPKVLPDVFLWSRTNPWPVGVYISLNTKVKPKTTFSPLRTGWCFCESHVPLHPSLCTLDLQGCLKSEVDEERADWPRWYSQTGVFLTSWTSYSVVACVKWCVYYSLFCRSLCTLHSTIHCLQWGCGQVQSQMHSSIKPLAWAVCVQTSIL